MSGAAPDLDVVVIGAGVAGLAASRTLREAGRSHVVLEAAGRVGGRAWTGRPEALGGEVFDYGAIWLHAAERNPLVADCRRGRRTPARCRPAAHAANLRRCQAGDRGGASGLRTGVGPLRGEAARLTAPGLPDVSLAEVARRLPDDPWARDGRDLGGPDHRRGGCRSAQPAGLAKQPPLRAAISYPRAGSATSSRAGSRRMCRFG